MFRPGYYEPNLIMMSFLGNSAARWAGDIDLARKDVRETVAQLPADTPCIFMTTAPAYTKKITDLRLKAQANVKQAFEEVGRQCTFIEGATPETVAANQGNKHYFRLNKAGKVKDPYHPNQKAAKNFFAIEMDSICMAIYEEISDAMSVAPISVSQPTTD